MKKRIVLVLLLLSIPVWGYLYMYFLFPLEIPGMLSSTVILDTSNQEIGELVYSGSIRHRPITYPEIPSFYLESLVWLEDRSFYENNGIDLKWVLRSAIHNVEAGKIREWASTLSSQLIRNIFWIDSERTPSRKIYEILASVRLNAKYSKEDILTMYSDRISFGYMNYGLASASRYFFAKDPKNLTEAEQIALLAIPKNPKRYDPYRNRKNLDERIRLIVRTLEAGGKISPEKARSILSERLSFNTRHENTLPYVADFIGQRMYKKTPWTLSVRSSPFSGGLAQLPPWEGGQGGFIKTTFSLPLTRKIEAIAEGALAELSWRNVSDYGVLVAERNGANPQLRVMIGGVNYRDNAAGQVNSTLALRQPGSTIKPFTYALAFRDLGLTPSDTILDLPVGYKTTQDYSYEPKNYSRDYRGQVTLAEALSQSINIPAIKLAERIWVQPLLDFLRSLGITSLTEDADHYGLALTLWDGEVSLYELLQAYTVFANDGVWCPFEIHEASPSSPSFPWKRESHRFTTEIKLRDPRSGSGMTTTRMDDDHCRSLLDRKYTDMVASILTDRYAKIESFPIGSPLDFPDRRVFVKTGTSRNFRDNWAVGFTDHYMIGVWTGNKNAENMKGVSGATGAGELFSRIVYALEPAEIEQKPIKRTAQTKPYLEITSPLSGSLYELNPLSSTSKQKIKIGFATNIPYDTSAWLLDGKILSGSFIDPTVGAHAIEIVLLKDGEIVGREKSEFRVK